MTGALSSKQNGGIQAKVQFELHKPTESVKLLDSVYSFWFIFTENISAVKPTNLSGFVSRLYAEKCILLSDYGRQNWNFTSPLHTSLVESQQKSVPLLPKDKILFLKFTLIF